MAPPRRCRCSGACAIVAVATVAVVVALLPSVVDYGQCRRACSRVHGTRAGGSRRFQLRLSWPFAGSGTAKHGALGAGVETCACFDRFNSRSLPAVPRLYESWNWTWPYETSQVCAQVPSPRVVVAQDGCGQGSVDGAGSGAACADAAEAPVLDVGVPRPFPSKEAAVAAGATPLNCGTCGACSTPHDRRRYHDMSSSMTRLASWCAIADLFLGEAVARACVHEVLGLTPACGACWVDNMGCTIAHCFKECVMQGGNPLVGRNNVDPEEEVLSPCLECDELHCSHVFMHCAGANRRSAGVATDIGRRASEVCDIPPPAPL